MATGTYAGSCAAGPSGAAVPTGVAITPVYGPGFAESWSGDRTTWHGQPAWLETRTEGGGTTLTLALPWANAAVTATSADAATARALPERVSVPVWPGLDAPATATSVEVEAFTGRDGDGLGRRLATVTRPDDVRRLVPASAL